MPEIAIKAQNLSKAYHDRVAISDISFEVHEGEIIGLLGLNGAGKSTILKILGGLLLPSDGVVRVFGCDVSNEATKLRSFVGFLSDNPPLYDDMTVEDFLKFVFGLKSQSLASLNVAVDEAIAVAKLEDVRSERISSLSHGYRQRVGIAQAIVHQPRLLILDEPINGLDPVQIVELRDLILNLKSKHTVILSSHILSEITRTCDRIFVIHKGRLIASGTEFDLKTTGSFASKCVLVLNGHHTSEELSKILLGLEGIVSIKSEFLHGRTRVEVMQRTDIRPQIVKVLIDADLQLFELRAIDQDLEQVFLELVRETKV